MTATRMADRAERADAPPPCHHPEGKPMTPDLDAIFALSHAIRYVAVLSGGTLASRQRDGLLDASASESDRYEELLVNPTLLKLATLRGEIDCGGLMHLVVGYGNFQQLVVPVADGHVSVCFEKGCNPQEHLAAILALMGCPRTGA